MREAAAPTRVPRGLSRDRSTSLGRPRPPARRATCFAGELVLQGAHDEVHHRHVGLDAIELQLAVELLRNAGRQLDPYLSFACHLASLPPVRTDTATLAYNYRDSLRSATRGRRIRQGWFRYL